MTHEEVIILRVGFNEGLRCAQNHPENDDYDTLYFERALQTVESMEKGINEKIEQWIS